MSSPSPEAEVYLEDVEPSRSQKQRDAAEKQAKKAANNPARPQKRQLQLTDLMPGLQHSSETKVVAKKIKTSETTFAVASSSASNSASSTLTPKLNSIPFSLSAFQESLSDEQKQYLALECTVMGHSWLKLLKDEITKPYFLALKKFLWTEGVRGQDDTPLPLKVYPHPRDIYSWSNTPLGRVKVVIIGQDPYHGQGQAHGLCFSVPKNVAVPPSLRNIYAEIKAEYPDFVPPKHGNLSAWAADGVLMLNTSLTVRANTAGSHKDKGWEEFTDKVVDVVDKYGGANLGSAKTSSNGIGRGVVFLVWGAWAAKRVAKLSKTKHLILASAHPSPFSAHKGFLGNGHFKTANDWLEKKYGPECKVNWCNLDPPDTIGAAGP